VRGGRARDRGAPAGVVIYVLDRAFEIRRWLCAACLAVEIADGWKVKGDPRPLPVEQRCDGCGVMLAPPPAPPPEAPPPPVAPPAAAPAAEPYARELAAADAHQRRGVEAQRRVSADSKLKKFLELRRAGCSREEAMARAEQETT